MPLPTRCNDRTYWSVPDRPQLSRVGAYGLVYDEAGRILLCRLCRPPKDAGLWTLPGGGMEWGEHPEETALREIREETGLEVRLGRLLMVDSETYENSANRMHALRLIYAAEVAGGELRPEADGTTDLCQFHPIDRVGALPMVSLVRIALGVI